MRTDAPIGGSPHALRDILAVLLCAGFVLAAMAGALQRHDAPDMPNFDAILSPPTLAHLLGTDELGRDVQSRVLGAAWTSLVIALLGIGGASLAGGGLGLLAGALGGWPDRLAMRAMDVILSFPGVLLALSLAAIFGAKEGVVTAAIALINTPQMARLARARTKVLKNHPLVEAEVALGFPPGQILLGTVLPHVTAPLVVQASLLLGGSIVTESYLSFLGLGVQPPTPTFGGMLHEALAYLDTAPWLAVITTGATILAVLSFNLAGDALQDRLQILEP
ncbi:MAG: ABC transporter permease [Alsobacter sp.]